jgi:hypothetical protein
MNMHRTALAVLYNITSAGHLPHECPYCCGDGAPAAESRKLLAVTPHVQVLGIKQ